MDFVITILVLIILGLGAGVWYLLKKKNESDREAELAIKEKGEYEELGRGLAEYNQKLQEKKSQVKAKILGMFLRAKKLSNHDIASEIGISRINVIRYLDEMEKEGKVRQVGKSGRAVFYEKI